MALVIRLSIVYQPLGSTLIAMMAFGRKAVAMWLAMPRSPCHDHCVCQPALPVSLQVYNTAC